MSAGDTYLTIETTSEGSYREKASRFISFAYPVRSEEEVKQILSALKKKYFDANHHCFAWRLGADKKRFRAYDDGEPSNTAGIPILGQIRTRELSNILVVVIRYFGGTKLGISGLINAYRTASANALENSKIIEKTVDRIYELKFPYPVMNDVMRIIKDENIKIIKQNSYIDCCITISVRQSLAPEVIAKLGKIGSVEVLGITDMNISRA